MDLKTGLSKLNEIRKKKGIIAFIKALLSAVSYFLYDRFAIKRMKKMPPDIVSNRILFESNDDFSDNCRALFDYMIENGYNRKYEIIWLVSDPKKYLQYAVHNVRFVKKQKRSIQKRSREAYYYALTSSYIFYAQSFNWVGLARKEQLFVDLWHGCGYKANKAGRKVFFDYLLVPGDLFIETKREFFSCSSNKILPIGYPRYDMMLRESSRTAAFRDSLLKQSSADHLVLWMPTYRHATSERLNEETIHNEFNIPILNTHDDLLKLDEICRKEHIVLIIKSHYLQLPYEFGDQKLTNIRYLKNSDLESEGVLLYEFIHYADALITDYSSVAIDYLLLDRPIGFTLDDFEEYSASRGWVFEDPLAYMPGEHIYNLEQFGQFLSHVHAGQDDYKDRRALVRSQAHNVCDNYCQRVLDYFNL